jgi:hypothetical protein
LPHNLVALPDLSGNGRPEIIVSGQNIFSVAEIKPDGALGKRLLNRRGRGVLVDVGPEDAFGFEMAHLGDLDGDGAPEVIVGAPETNEGALNAGAVWIVGISPTPVRNGVGTNPLTLSSPQAPVIGAPWDASLDCSAQAPGLAILLGWDTPIEGLHLPQGELLLDPFNGNQVFARAALHASDTQNFSIAVPLDPSLIDFVLYAQGVCGGLPAAQLSNGLAFVVGD